MVCGGWGFRPRNFVREGNTLRAIDLDSAVAIGGRIGLKNSPGVLPSNAAPEYGQLQLRARFPTRVIEDVLRNEKLDATHRAEWTDCLEIVQSLDQAGVPLSQYTLDGAEFSYDVWGIGLIFYRLFVGSPLYRS